MIPGLRQHRVVGELLRALEQPERLVVGGLGAAHARVEAPGGLDVVVEDVGPLGQDRAEGLLLDAEEVGREDLDRRLGQLVLERADRRGVVAGAAIGDVVAVDRRDDDVLEVHLGRRRREPERLERVGRMLGPAGVHVAVAAGAGAGVAEDLEGGGAAAPALGDVRAARLFADRVQARAVDQLAHVEVRGVRARCANLHPLRAARPLSDRQRALHQPECREAVRRAVRRGSVRLGGLPGVEIDVVDLVGGIPAGRREAERDRLRPEQARDVAQQELQPR